MDTLWQAISPTRPRPEDYKNIDFWDYPDHAGWLSKQGEYLLTWRRRWFVLKEGTLLWFMNPNDVISTAVPRGVIKLGQCEVVEDVVGKPCSFQVTIHNWSLTYVADNEKEKKEWINSIKQAIFQNSSSVDREIPDYGKPKRE